MKNKKLLKAIAATMICSAMGLTAFSFAACGGNNEGGEGGEGTGGGAHQHSYSWVDDENYLTHHRHCSVEGCDEPDKPSEDHTWAGDECSKCHAAALTEEERALVPEYKGAAAGPEAGTKEFNLGFKGSDIEKGNLTEDWTDGVFTIAKGAEARDRKDTTNVYTRSVKNAVVTVNVPTAATLTFIFASGSTGGGAQYKISKPDGTSETVTITTGDKVLNTVEIEAEPGTYKFEKANGTVDVFECKLTYSSTASPIKEIAISNTGTTDYLVTQKVDCTGLTLVAKDETGATYPVNLENCRFDTSKYVPFRSGEYEIGVTYYLASNLDSATKEFKATYKVKVYMIDSIELSTIGLASNKQVTLQQAYLPNEAFKKDYLSVIASCSLGESTTTQKLKNEWYTVSTPTLTAEGTQTVTVSVDPQYTGNKPVSASYDVVVKAKKEVADNKVEVTVGETGEFKTLTQAVQYLKACSYEASVNKVIKLQAGTYTEKVWIDMPNVTLIGLGEKIDDTAISYSLVEGDADKLSNALWALNCATIHVTGANFKAYNLAIRNDFDYIANNKNYSGSQAAQGVALTLEGDGNVIYNCHLYGNQDTLYMKSGRTYFKDSQIDGNIDFIFGGETGLAYFDQCEIVAIDREQKESANPQNGYVTAPQHKAATKPDYGYIFYKCNLTDDGNVNDAAMSLGRPWGDQATVSYIECKFSDAYSQNASDSTYTNDEGTTVSHKIHRWNDWSGGATADSVDYSEFGSMDASGNAIMTEAVKGGKVLTADQAANATKANIFGTSNGKQKYTTVFDCDSEYANLRILVGLDNGQIVENPVETYDFTDVEKNAQVDINEHLGGKLEWTGSGRWNGNSIQVSNDTVIKIAKPGKVSINWFENLGSDKDAEITYDADGKATIKIVTSGVYIVSITVNGDDIPAQSVDRTVSVYVIDGEGEPQLLTTITKPDGGYISEANLVSLITAEKYPGKMLDKVYTSDKTTEYDYSAITADTDLYITLKDSSKVWQAGENVSLAFGGNVKPVVAGVEFSSGIVGNGAECRTNFGETIRITAAAGTTAQINWHSNGGPTKNNAKIEYIDGQIVITIKAPEEGEEGNFKNGTLYIISIDIVAAE